MLKSRCYSSKNWISSYIRQWIGWCQGHCWYPNWWKYDLCALPYALKWQKYSWTWGTWPYNNAKSGCFQWWIKKLSLFDFSNASLLRKTFGWKQLLVLVFKSIATRLVHIWMVRWRNQCFVRRSFSDEIEKLITDGWRRLAFVGKSAFKISKHIFCKLDFSTVQSNLRLTF